MVNLLPVSTNVSMDLSTLSISNSQGEKTVLSGNPADKKVYPVSSKVAISKEFRESLPAYSFTVLKIAGK